MGGGGGGGGALDEKLITTFHSDRDVTTDIQPQLLALPYLIDIVKIRFFNHEL